MRIVYACYGGAHSSAVAAWIHLGKLPLDRIPSAEEILRVPKYDRTLAGDFGRARLAGRDEWGNEVYVLGRGPCAKPVERALESGFRMAGGDGAELMIVNTLTCVNLSMRVGGFLSRRLGWTGIGRPIVLWGTLKAYPRLARLVRTTKGRLAGLKAEPRTERGAKLVPGERKRLPERAPRQGNPS